MSSVFTVKVEGSKHDLMQVPETFESQEITYIRTDIHKAKRES